jgi:hypothetical protein
MKYCVKCGSEIADEAHFCPKCGAEQPSASDYAAGGVDASSSAPIEAEPVQSNYASTNANTNQSSAPMVLGILSIALAGLAGLILGIIGIGKSTCKRDHTLNLIGIIVSSFYLVFLIVYVAIVTNSGYYY